METVTSADGTTIAYERTGSGPPLVLVHGAALDHSYWELSDLHPELAEHYTVYAIERRGRGGSGDAEAYDLDREFEDVAAVVNSIDEPVTLLGHSFGALIALEAALRSDDLHGLVLYEPFFGPEIPPEIEQLVGAIEALVANGEKEQALITQLTAAQFPEATLEELRSGTTWQAFVDLVDMVPREWGGIFEYEFDPDRFEGMTTPTVLFSGEESHPALIAATEIVDEGLPNSRIIVFEGSGHWAMNTATDRFVDEVRTFVRGAN
jgi:pimeloyl-ACP methyl ester carboxylesterase